MIQWHSIAKDGLPKRRGICIVTYQDDDGTRHVCSDVRFLDKSGMVKEAYTEEYINAHPGGVWEWAYEAGADYWEEFDANIIAWTFLDEIQPFQGE